MSVETKSIASPDATVNFPNGHANHMSVGGMTVSVMTANPGWKWSEHVKPRVCTESCEKEHYGYMISGRMACQMTGEDKVVEFGTGDAVHIPPGHDGWVVGDADAVMVEFTPKELTPFAVKKD